MYAARASMSMRSVLKAVALIEFTQRPRCCRSGSTAMGGEERTAATRHRVRKASTARHDGDSASDPIRIRVS
ncbi:MAG: hypothetical protein EAZ30_10280 [Betaproteobacteria bacterium]|nr:MAG: hypothetical protein EAZ43_07740 [Betaproteobacteria bacterium]TAG47173.1 MAG: hypothetical protein EAZ30_10280 [Betaproteobacteria bacterium]